MNAVNCVLFQKGDGAVVNSYNEWGIATRKVPFKTGGKVKSLAKTDWKDEHGADEYFPAKLCFEPYEIEVEFAYAGRELASNPFNLSLATTQIANFINWLSGNDSENGTGSELKIYFPYTGIGRQKCRLSEISDEDPHLQLVQVGSSLYNENVVTFKVKFMVTDPVTYITLSETNV